jgi:hypothetical protein
MCDQAWIGAPARAQCGLYISGQASTNRINPAIEDQFAIKEIEGRGHGLDVPAVVRFAFGGD